MRNAEARVTLGVVAARRGDIGLAVEYGRKALEGERRSIPSLLMCSSELAQVVSQRNAEPEVQSYLDQINTLRRTA